MSDWKEQLSKFQKPKTQTNTSVPPNATLLQEILSKNKEAKELLDALAPLPFFDIAVGKAVSDKFETEFEKLRKIGVVCNVDDGLYVIDEEGKEAADSSVINTVAKKVNEFLPTVNDKTDAYDELQKTIAIYGDEAKIGEYFSEYENSDENDIWTRGYVDFKLLSYTNSIKNLSNISFHQAEALYIRASSLLYSRNNAKAFELFKKVANSEHNSYFVAEASRRAGYIGNKFRYDFAKGLQPSRQECINLINKAIQISQSSQEPKMLGVRAKSLSMLGNIYTKQHKYKEAETKLNESLEIGKNDQKHVAQVLHDLGNLYTKQPTKYEEAETKLNESLEILKKIPDQKGIAQVLHDLGNLYTKQPTKYEEAETKLNESLEIGKNDQKHVAQVLHDLGNLYTKQPTKYEEAETKLNESLEIGKNDQKHVAQVLHDLGNLYTKQPTKYEEAETKLNESLEILKKIPDQKGIAQVLHDLGNLYTKQQRYEEAETKLNESLEIEKGINNQKGIAQVTNSLGKLFEKSEDIGLALKFYKLSLEYHSKLELYKFVEELEGKIKKLGG